MFPETRIISDSLEGREGWWRGNTEEILAVCLHERNGRAETAHPDIVKNDEATLVK